MRNRIYRQWNEHFVVSKGKESYVRTTNDSNQTVVLSEAQSYGMLITVAAAKKGQAQQADFDRLYQYYLNHRLEVPNWCLGNKPSAMEKQRTRTITPQMEISILPMLF